MQSLPLSSSMRVSGSGHNSAQSSPRAADVSAVRKFMSSTPLSGTKAPLIWMAQDLFALTKDSDANRLGDVYNVDPTLQYLSHLLHSVPMFRDEDFLDAIAGTSDINKGEVASQVMLLEFIATLAFALTSSQQFDNILAKTLALFDKPEYDYVAGLLFAHAYTNRAVMGFLSRLVGFGKKSVTLVQSLFNNGVGVVLAIFKRIRSLSASEAKPLVGQFDSIIMQLRIVVRTATAEGPEATKKSGIIQAIQKRSPELRACLDSCFTGEQFSVPVSAALLSLINTIVEALSPVTPETKFLEDIISPQHLRILAGSVAAVAVCCTSPVDLDRIRSIADTLWSWRITQIFTTRAGEPVAPKQMIPPPSGSVARSDKDKSNPFAQKKSSKSKDGDRKVTRATSVAPAAKDIRTDAEKDMALRMQRVLDHNDGGDIRWGPISHFIIALIDTCRVVCCARSKFWTEVASGENLVAILAHLMKLVTNDVVANVIVTAIYRILENALPEVLSEKGAARLRDSIVQCIKPSTTGFYERRPNLAATQARMIRLLALLKYQIKKPTAPVSRLLKEMNLIVPSVEEILPSWHEAGLLEGIPAATMKDPDAIDGISKPKASGSSSAKSIAQSPEEKALMDQIQSELDKMLNLARSSTGAVQEEHLRNYMMMKQQLDTLLGRPFDPTPPSLAPSSAPAAFVSLQKTETAPSPSESDVITIQEFQLRAQRLLMFEAELKQKSAQLEMEFSSLSESDKAMKLSLYQQQKMMLEGQWSQGQAERAFLTTQESRLLAIAAQQQAQLAQSRLTLPTGAASTISGHESHQLVPGGSPRSHYSPAPPNGMSSGQPFVGHSGGTQFPTAAQPVLTTRTSQTQFTGIAFPSASVSVEKK